MKRLILTCLACAAALAAVGIPASANHDPTAVPTRISIGQNPDVHGLVWTPISRQSAQHRRIKRQCSRHRTVTIWKDKPSLDQLVGSGFTGSVFPNRGRYSIPVDLHHGDYYARVNRRTLRSGVVCRRARSFNLAVQH